MRIGRLVAVAIVVASLFALSHPAFAGGESIGDSIKLASMKETGPVNYLRRLDGQYSLMGGSVPLELSFLWPVGATKVRIDAYLVGDDGKRELFDDYSAPAPAGPAFRLCVHETLGNLRSGLNEYEVAVSLKSGGTDKALVRLAYWPQEDFRGSSVLPPAAAGDKLDVARIAEGAFVLGEPYPEPGDPAFLRLGLNFYVKTDGSTLRPPSGQAPWIAVCPFRGGLAWVLEGTRVGYSWAAIGPDGKRLFSSDCARCSDFVAGYVLAQDRAGTWSVLDSSGKTVFDVGRLKAELSGPPTLWPKTLTFTAVAGKSEASYCYALPSGRAIAAAEGDHLDVFETAGGGVVRVVSSADPSGAKGAVTFLDENGRALGTAALAGRPSPRGYWDPEAETLTVAVWDAKGQAREYVTLRSSGERLRVSMLDGCSLIAARSGRYLLGFGDYAFSYDPSTGKLGDPFRPKAQWLDPLTSQEYDARTRLYTLRDALSGAEVVLPAGKKAMAREGRCVVLGGFDPAVSDGSDALVTVFHAIVNDSGVRVRSNPSLDGRILAKLKLNAMVTVDGLGEEVTAVDGRPGLWAHVRRDERGGVPEGWIYSRFLSFGNWE